MDPGRGGTPATGDEWEWEDDDDHEQGDEHLKARRERLESMIQKMDSYGQLSGPSMHHPAPTPGKSKKWKKSWGHRVMTNRIGIRLRSSTVKHTQVRV